MPSLTPHESIPALCEGLTAVIELFSFDDDLISILSDLQNLTSVLNNTAMDLFIIDRIITPIQHNLLSFQFAGYELSQKAVFQEVCCIGALVYIKTIYDFYHSLQLGRFPAGTLTDGAIIQKLKSCLDMIDTNTAQTKALFLWMLFLGGTAVVGTSDRAWFVARLVKTAIEFQICSWEDVRLSLMKFLWIDRIHENFCKELWDEALVTLDVLF